MDAKGFSEFLLKKKRSPRGVDFYLEILKKFRNFLQKHQGHNNIDSSSSEDLLAFGRWLKEENFQQTIIKLYIQVLRDYFTFIEKAELARIAEDGFK